jgi:hypothetical protein
MLEALPDCAREEFREFSQRQRPGWFELKLHQSRLTLL